MPVKIQMKPVDTDRLCQIRSAVMHYESESHEPSHFPEECDVSNNAIVGMFNDIVLLADTLGVRLPAIEVVNHIAERKHPSCDLHAKAQEAMRQIYS